MIKINKDITNIPKSLKPAFEELFDDRRIPQTSRTTHEKRIDIINQGRYIDDGTYNSRYKLEEIKIALNSLYFHKCAFCEQRVEQVQVEHYRPKRDDKKYLDSYAYYWLAFSWDNLLIACPTCNTYKSVHFAISAERVIFINSEDNLKNINSLSMLYDDAEQPLCINPEITDPYSFLIFTKDGKISSTNLRFEYTIKTCHLDRADLNDQRRKLLDDFKKDVRAELIEHRENIDKQKEAITTLVRKFKRRSEDKEKQFLAFRRYAIVNDWLNDSIKEAVNN